MNKTDSKNLLITQNTRILENHQKKNHYRCDKNNHYSRQYPKRENIPSSNAQQNAKHIANFNLYDKKKAKLRSLRRTQFKIQQILRKSLNF